MARRAGAGRNSRLSAARTSKSWVRRGGTMGYSLQGDLLEVCALRHALPCWIGETRTAAARAPWPTVITRKILTAWTCRASPCASRVFQNVLKAAGSSGLRRRARLGRRRRLAKVFRGVDDERVRVIAKMVGPSRRESGADLDHRAEGQEHRRWRPVQRWWSRTARVRQVDEEGIAEQAVGHPQPTFGGAAALRDGPRSWVGRPQLLTTPVKRRQSRGSRGIYEGRA